MKSWKLVSLNIALLCGVFMVGKGMSQQDTAPPKDDKHAIASGMPDMQTMMKKWIATVKPGPSHKWLDQFVGEWTTTTKMWMGGPSAPPSETKGVASFKWVCDGRFLLQEIDGQMMMPDETGQVKSMRMTGMGLFGYDNYRNLYVANFCNSQSTAMITYSGNRAPNSNVLTMYGEMDEPMLDAIGRMVKYVTRVESDKKFVFEIHDMHAGDGMKVVEVIYEKK